MDYDFAARFGELCRATRITVSVHARIAGFMGHAERGKIESGPNAGYGYVEYFVDRGGPSAGAGDRNLGSGSFQDPPNASSWPAGFP